MPADLLTHPNDVTRYLRDNATYAAILTLPDRDLEELTKALGDALIVARNAIFLRRQREEGARP
ncbi:MAG: hypothetical protein KAX46_03075 [Chromatiaceae bacterium]|nr:hypothetical protein [Chromatiaceae bacterium]